MENEETYRESKRELRKKMRKYRQGMTGEEKEYLDLALCETCLGLMKRDGFLSSCIYLYLDFRGEAGTRRILEALWAKNICTALPRVEGEEIYFYAVKGYDDVAPGYLGIEEPLARCPQVNEPSALVLVPGVAFDVEGRRLGYGKGYYDRFFAREPKHPRWGLAYAFQVVDQLTDQVWDQKVDRVITPEKVIEVIHFLDWRQ